MFNHNTGKTANTHIEFIISPELARLKLSYYRNYLVLNFVPWVRKDRNGVDKYSKEVFRSTTLDTEGAMTFYRLAKSIVDGSASDKRVNFVLPCKNGAELLFVYKLEEDGQMEAYLVINKEDLSIGIRFPTRQYVEVGEDGEKVTKVIQSGLGTFAKVLDGYLVEQGADDKSNKLPVNFNEYQDYNKQAAPQPSTEWNNTQL